MRGYLLDTNVVSELNKKEPDRGVLLWFDEVDENSLFLSVLSLGEIRLGIERLQIRDPARSARLEAWFGQLVTAYQERLVGIDEKIADTWGRLGSIRPVPVIDGLLGATCIVGDLVLCTRNTSDFHGLDDVRVVNPFRDQ